MPQAARIPHAVGDAIRLPNGEWLTTIEIDARRHVYGFRIANGPNKDKEIRLTVRELVLCYEKMREMP